MPCSQFPGCSGGCQQLHHIKQPLQVPEGSITFKGIKKKMKSWLSRQDTVAQRNAKPALGLSPSLPELSLSCP